MSPNRFATQVEVELPLEGVEGPVFAVVDVGKGGKPPGSNEPSINEYAPLVSDEVAFKRNGFAEDVERSSISGPKEQRRR